MTNDNKVNTKQKRKKVIFIIFTNENTFVGAYTSRTKVQDVLAQCGIVEKYHVIANHLTNLENGGAVIFGKIIVYKTFENITFQLPLL